MNNLQLILDRINEEADREISEIEMRRDEELERISDELEAEISKLEAEAEARAMSEYQRIIARAESSGDMNERRTVLAAKSKLVDKVYRDAAQSILSLPHVEYASVMSRLLADAVIDRCNTVLEMTEIYDDGEFAADGKQPFDVLISERDREHHSRDIIAGAEKIIALRDLNVPKIRLSKESANISGGFILRHGSAEINCSIEEMLRYHKENRYGVIADMLFS